jgi:hypothetical protein
MHDFKKEKMMGYSFRNGFVNRKINRFKKNHINLIKSKLDFKYDLVVVQ